MQIAFQKRALPNVYFIGTPASAKAALAAFSATARQPPSSESSCSEHIESYRLPSTLLHAKGHASENVQLEKDIICTDIRNTVTGVI